MELMVDFSQHLPKHMIPPYRKMVSLLTQTVPEFTKGAAMLTQGRNGVFFLKVYDKIKGNSLIGRKIDYFPDEDRNASVTVLIQEKKQVNQQYKNAKNITLVGFERFPANQIENHQLDEILKKHGNIINKTEDVYSDVFLTGKKKVRVDLCKGFDLPRIFHIEFTNTDGYRRSATIRTYYTDQPYFCERCQATHVTKCPKILEDLEKKARTDEKKKERQTVRMIGDSNLRCVNENGVMANVTAITGGKIGHICNQIQYTDLNTTNSVVLSAGQNCINDIEAFTRPEWEKKTNKEIEKYEKTAKKLKNEGKNVFLLAIPPAPITQVSKESKSARNYINEKISGISQRSMKDKTPGKGLISFISQEDGNYNKSTDFSDERHLSELAVNKVLTTLDNLLPNGQKLFDINLKDKPTGKPYRGCYGTFPIGCQVCTSVGHNENTCSYVTGNKRNLSQGDESDSKKPKQ